MTRPVTPPDVFNVGVMKSPRRPMPTQDVLYDLLPDAVDGMPADLSALSAAERRQIVLALLGEACGGRVLPPLGRAWTFRQIRMDGEWGRLRAIASAVRPSRGSQLWQPESVGDEYRQLQRRSRTDLLQLVVDVNAQNLFVDGYRRKQAQNNSAAWKTWQRNRMDARQGGIHRTVVTLGYCYAAVDTDTAGRAAYALWSPLRTYGWYAESGWTDEDPSMSNEWPTLVLRYDRQNRVSVYDAYRRWLFEVAPLAIEGSATLSLEFRSELGATKLPDRLAGDHPPVVRYAGRCDLIGDALGEVETQIPVQQRVEETTFSALMAQTYNAFRQRWATGMEVPKNSDGTPRRIYIDPHQSILPNTSPDGRFGDFGIADLQGYATMLDQHIKTGAALGQLPPQALLGSMDNVGADGLAAASAGSQRRASDYKTSIGEGHEQLLRTGALAEGSPGADDYDSEVVWRDTEAFALQSMAQGLVALKALGIPDEALWELLPGITLTQINAWKTLRRKAEAEDPFRAAMLTEIAGGREDQPPLPGMPGDAPAEPAADAA